MRASQIFGLIGFIVVVVYSRRMALSFLRDEPRPKSFKESLKAVGLLLAIAVWGAASVLFPASLEPYPYPENPWLELALLVMPLVIGFGAGFYSFRQEPRVIPRPFDSIEVVVESTFVTRVNVEHDSLVVQGENGNFYEVKAAEGRKRPRHWRAVRLVAQAELPMLHQANER